MYWFSRETKPVGRTLPASREPVSLAVGMSGPSQLGSSLLCLLIPDMRSPEWLGGSVNFHSVQSLLCFLVETFLPMEI